MMQQNTMRGMTLIETLVAVTILTVAIVAPMSLTVQSLSAAYYARDNITAFHLAQEALEAVRAVRDENILKIAYGETDPSCSPMHLLCDIPIDADFTVDARTDPPTLTSCSGTCAVLKTDGELYGYESGWSDTKFRRTLHASFVGAGEDEIHVVSTVAWTTDSGQTRSFVLETNLYRWVNDGSASTAE